MSQAAESVPAENPEPAGRPEPAERTEPAEAVGSRRVMAAALLGAVTVALGSFGIWAMVTAGGLRSAAADANVALTDRQATAAVSRQITHTVQTIFSYNFAYTARTKASAQRLLAGAAVRQYDQLFKLVEQQAPKQRLVVTTRVSSVGVEFLTGARARILVFANQQDTREGTSQSSYGGAMFAVTAVDQHGTWKIVNIDTFTGGG